MPGPSRLEVAALGGLEGEYAVLEEAAARDAALQARLRNSQPLLWLDDAYVLRREPRWRSSKAPTPDNHDDDDDGDDALLRLLGDTGRRRQRRLQWEVAKRIARVDRELRARPPPQRFWRVREHQRQLLERQRQEREARELEDRERQRRRREQEQEQQRRKVATAVIVRARPTIESHRGRRNVEFETTRPHKADAIVDLELGEGSSDDEATRPKGKSVEPDKAPKPSETNKAPRKEATQTRATGPSSMPRPLSPTDGKENVQPPASPPSPVGSNELGRSQPPPPPSSSPELAADVEPIAVVDSFSAIARASLEDVAGDGPGRRGSSSRLVDIEDITVEASSHRPPPPREEVRNPSSLGRQVLSEFRTMPSAPSFGAPAILQNGSTTRRLNGEVLRRLFSDLDGDRDGHLNRIETCMALHRLQISVPAPKIVDFFKRINAVNSNLITSPGSRRSRPPRNLAPLKEVINFKQFVAFVTTAFEQQVRQDQSKDRQTPNHGSWTKKSSRPELRPLDIPTRTTSGQSSTQSPVRQEAEITLSVRKKSHDNQEPPVQRRLVTIQTENDDDYSSLTERILTDLPDYLVSQVLEGDASTSAGAPATVIRQSLEKISPHARQDVEMFRRCASELMKEFVTTIIRKEMTRESLDFDEAACGLLGAAAEFMDTGDDNTSLLPSLDERTDISGQASDWWKTLTEEHITSIVRQVWKERRDELDTHAHQEQERYGANEQDNRVQEAECSENRVDSSAVSPEATPIHQEENRTIAISPSVLRVAEKAVQTGSVELRASSLASGTPVVEDLPNAALLLPENPTPDVAPIDMSSPTRIQDAQEPGWAPKTALASILLGDLDGPPPPADALDVLNQMRRERMRRQHRSQPNPQAREMTEAIRGRDACDVLSVVSSGDLVTPVGENSTATMNLVQPMSSSRVGDSVTQVCQGIASDDEENDEPPPPPPPLSPAPVVEKVVEYLSNDEDHAAADHRTGLPSSSFSSFGYSDLSSTNSSCFSRGIQPAMFLRPRMDADVVYPRLKRRTASSRRSRTQSEDLSDGEIGHFGSDGEDLSDGELFGPTKRFVLRSRNHQIAACLEQAGDEGRRSSVESGEMQPTLTMMHAHRERIWNTLSVSIESGEIEDGAVDVGVE